MRPAPALAPTALAPTALAPTALAPTALAPSRVRFGPCAWLTREEVFSACQVLADAGSRLHVTGEIAEAEALNSLFVLLEGRLVRRRG